MTEQEIEQLIQFLKALADKTRLRILGLIATEERSVEEIASVLALKEPTVSHHLNKLKESRLVTMRPEGTTHFYLLHQEQLSVLLRDLSPKALREVSEDLDTGGFDRKVLQSFFVDGRLKEIPAQRKKREVILRRLVEEFAPEQRYTEKQINETLKRFHEDTATLRREFIGNGLMARADSIYWRINDTD
jgi:predicted transcriptional regulator